MKESKLKQILLSIWDWYYLERNWRKVVRSNQLSIMNSRETIAYIKKHGCSIARYGDGEFDIMYRGRNVGYQICSTELSNALIHVLENHSKNLLICIPYPLVSVKGMKPHGKKFWKNWIVNDDCNVIKELSGQTGEHYCFGDAFVSRPYTGYKNKKHAKIIFGLLKEVWEKRNILIVEGKQTRLGVGNNLFDNAKSIKRILIPSENAFEKYPVIFQTILDFWRGELVVLAAGPTATILASDLSKENIQALDLGHVDIQYEWFLNGNDFETVAGKYTNEAKERPDIRECVDGGYLSQIIVDLSAVQ